MDAITPCLWFDGDAEAAVEHYLSIFPNSRRLETLRAGPGLPVAEGSSLTIAFELDGRPFSAINGGDTYRFTPAVSFVLTCSDQDELDHYWDRLLEGGAPVQCGWLTDRFGVSWQIVPSRLAELLGDPDRDRARRVGQAMLQMVKLDIAALEAAASSR